MADTSILELVESRDGEGVAEFLEGCENPSDLSSYQNKDGLSLAQIAIKNNDKDTAAALAIVAPIITELSTLDCLVLIAVADDREEFEAELEEADTAVLTTERNWKGEGLVAALAGVITNICSIPLVPGSEDQRAMLDSALAAGADPNLATDSGWTALHTAAMSDDTQLISTLLAGGADPTATLWGTVGGTPLSLTLFYAHTGSGTVLSDQGGRVPNNIRTAAALGDSDGVAAFFDAETGALDVAAASVGRDFYRPIEAFPEFEPTLDEQETLDEALTWAARNGQTATMAQLVEKGAGVNSNAYRGTPLLWAVYGGRTAAIRWLVAAGADVNLTHDFGGAEHGLGATALHLAAQYSHTECVTVLLELGADPGVRDAANDGTPLDWAVYCGGDDATIEVLKPVTPARTTRIGSNDGGDGGADA